MNVIEERTALKNSESLNERRSVFLVKQDILGRKTFGCYFMKNPVFSLLQKVCKNNLPNYRLAPV